MRLYSGVAEDVDVRLCHWSHLRKVNPLGTYTYLVRQCQQALNDISTEHAVGLYWVPGHVGMRGNEIADELARSGSVQRFVGPEPFLGISRQNTRRKMKRWMKKQHLVLWRGPCGTQRQARDLRFVVPCIFSHSNKTPN